MPNTTVKEYDNNEKKSPKIKRFLKTFLFDFIFIAFCAFCLFYEFPFYIYSTGGSINLNERIIKPKDPKYSGSYSMNYVTVIQGKLPTLVLALIRSDWDIVKENEVTVPNTSYDETLKLEKIELQNSLNLAKKVAFTNAGIPYEIVNNKCYIYYVDEKAHTSLEVLDEILFYDDIPFTELSVLQDYINSFEEGHEFTFKVKDKEGKEEVRKGQSMVIGDRKVIGVSLLTNFAIESETEVEIETKASEAGPSGGLMLTLAIYDAINEEDLAAGRTVMGTGTISEDGTVGEIGGVKYKMLGAEKDGADIFFVPEGNYEEAKKVYKEYELSFDLVKVDNFSDAINYLKG